MHGASLLSLQRTIPVTGWDNEREKGVKFCHKPGEIQEITRAGKHIEKRESLWIIEGWQVCYFKA